ncbi:MAG: hypothetical protein OSA99_20695, partial [Acidimicrobiales bacterium]|nr:hypothetical protein [Acidimicrobiales bacterium]
RLQALGNLGAAGVPTHCSVSPIIPAITDEFMEEIVQRAAALGVDSVGWIRLVSAGLVLIAVDVALVARRAQASLPTAALAISLADLVWVAATVVALATIRFTTIGWILAVVIGVGVLDFALAQLWFRRRLA